MPRTSNRSPISVPTASTNFTKKNFFTQSKWSGLNDNKDIATIDAQSFNDCNNVYLDMNNVLCSRPAFKRNGMFDNDVVRFWEVAQDQVLEFTVDGTLRLKGTEDVFIDCGTEISVVQVEGRVYVFNNEHCWVYEDRTFTLVTRENIQNYIYIPEVEVYTDGNPTEFETKNMATDYVAYTHIRGVESFLDDEELAGEIVYYEDEDGNEVNTLWIKDITNRVLLDYYTRRKFDYIYMAKGGGGAIGIDSGQLFYTTNGIAWKQIPLPENRLGNPKITEDGTTALILLPSGLHAYTLVAAGMDGEAEFPVWTNICKPFTRQFTGEAQRSDFLNGNLRNFTKLLGLEAISYDNYVLVAAGPLDENNSKTIVNVYTTHPSFLRLSDNTEGEKLYKGMSIETSGTNFPSTEEIKFNTRADKTNSYTRIPICRTLADVDTNDTVKIRLKQFLYQNSQLFAILFKNSDFNSKTPTGLPIGPFYYDNDGKAISNTAVEPDNNTKNSNSDKLRYTVFFVSPGLQSQDGHYEAKKHYLTALGDPYGISNSNLITGDATSATITDNQKNLLQREVRTCPMSIRASVLSSSLSTFGTVGTQLKIENIGFEFMENQLEVASQNYNLRFFFPLSAYSAADGGNISLGLFDKTITIRNGDTMTIIQGFPQKPTGTDFAIGERIISGTSATFNDMWFRIRPGDTNRAVGLRAYFVTDAKGKNQSEFTGTARFLAPQTLKLKLDSSNRVNGSAPSMAQNDAECILERGGDREKTNSPNFNETDLIDIMRDMVSRRMSEANANNINDLASTSKVYAPMDPAGFDGKLYDLGGGIYYKLTFTPFKQNGVGYTITAASFDNPDKTIYISNANREVKNYGNRPVTDKGDYYIDCWFNWDGYYVTFEPYTYNPDAGWNINDAGSYIWYSSTSPLGDYQTPNTEDGKIYSNKVSMELKDIPYYISEKDLDRTVLTPEYMLVAEPGQAFGTFYPTVSKFTEIQYFGQFTFAKNAAGFYMTSLYTQNKPFKYYYKQGREFKLRVLDGWIENSKKIYAWISNTIFIEDRRYDRNKKPLLYIPEGSVEQRDKIITQMTNFSKGVVGIFHENELWYMYPNYDNDGNFVGYIYSKGKVGLGITLGGAIETLYDGKTICFATYRGIVGLQYEELTQNEEQVLTYLSDTISDVYQKFYVRSGAGCLIFQFKYWVFFWQKGFKDFLVFDIRNSSWWPMSFAKPVLAFAKYKDTLYIRTEDGWGTPSRESWYLDYDEHIIPWHFQSQELHFNLINYRKRILNITLQSLETSQGKFSCILTCKNYRKRSFVSPEQVLEYKVDGVRTYVHRLNYMQTLEFQYKVSNDSSRAPKEQTPAALSATVVKYEVGEAVR